MLSEHRCQSSKATENLMSMKLLTGKPSDEARGDPYLDTIGLCRCSGALHERVLGQQQLHKGKQLVGGRLHQILQCSLHNTQQECICIGVMSFGLDLIAA